MSELRSKVGDLTITTNTNPSNIDPRDTIACCIVSHPGVGVTHATTVRTVDSQATLNRLHAEGIEFANKQSQMVLLAEAATLRAIAESVSPPAGMEPGSPSPDPVTAGGDSDPEANRLPNAGPRK